MKKTWYPEYQVFLLFLSPYLYFYIILLFYTSIFININIGIPILPQKILLKSLFFLSNMKAHYDEEKRCKK